jgi:hypothetical protein
MAEFSCQCQQSEGRAFCQHWQRTMGPEERTICAGRELLIDGKPFNYDRNLYVNTWSVQRVQNSTDEAVALDAKRSKHPCVYLELQSPGTTPCGCGGSTTKTVALHGCKKHGSCTVCHPSAKDRAVRCCKTVSDTSSQYCPDFDPDESLQLNCLTNGQTALIASGPQLTLGMAVGDGEQFSAVWAAIHGNIIAALDVAVASRLELVVVDCSTDTKFSEELERHVVSLVVNKQKIGQYFRYSGNSGTSGPRNAVFEKATGKAVVCIDPHVVLFNGCLQSVYNYLSTDPESLDLLVGPLVQRHLTEDGVECQKPVWGKSAFGVWGHVPEMKGTAGEFEVFQQGLGFFASTRRAWLRHGGFHKEARGFGGCETYLCEKVRRFGGRVLCSNTRKWHHRFVDEAKVTVKKWSSSYQDTYRNYLIGFSELGQEEWLTGCVKTYKKLLTRQDLVSGLMGSTKLSGSKVTPEMLQRLLVVANSDV